MSGTGPRAARPLSTTSSCSARHTIASWEQRDGATILADSNLYVTRNARIDYCFLGAEIAGGLVTARVDREAAGSDHQPLWVEIRM